MGEQGEDGWGYCQADCCNHTDDAISGDWVESLGQGWQAGSKDGLYYVPQSNNTNATDEATTATNATGPTEVANCTNCSSSDTSGITSITIEYTPDMAVDGNSSTFFKSNCSQEYPWLVVDLGKARSVAKVRVVGRDLNKVFVRYKSDNNGDPTRWPFCGRTRKSVDEHIFNCPRRRDVRYLSVAKYNEDFEGEARCLEVAEVEIWEVQNYTGNILQKAPKIYHK